MVCNITHQLDEILYLMLNPINQHDGYFVFTVVMKAYLLIVWQLLHFGLNVDMLNSRTKLNLLKVTCTKKQHEIAEILLKYNVCVNTTIPTNCDFINIELNSALNLEKIYRPLSLADDENKKLRKIMCLNIAVLNSDSEMTKLLLNYGAEIMEGPQFWKIARVAVENNCEQIVRMFLNCGVNVKDINSNGLTLLNDYFSFLVMNDNSNIPKLLLDNGATELIQNPGNSFLFKAVENGNYKIAELFLDYNADTQYVHSDGNTLLHKAVANRFNAKFIKTLLQHNSSVNVKNNEMLTPLLIASQFETQDQLEIINVLLDYNADINCTNRNMMTPLHFACRNQNLEVVETLLQKGADPNAKNNEGQTPLHFACIQSYVECVMMDKCFNLIKFDKGRRLKIVQLLLQYNANIEAVDMRGWTPLFIACKTGNNEVVKILLNNNANVNHIDFQKFTLLHVAVYHCTYDTNIIKMLLKRKINFHSVDPRGNSIIHLIAATDFVDLIKPLARTQINFNKVNKEGNSPLHVAVDRKCINMIEKLIKYGANVNILDKKNRTPLQNAMNHLRDSENNYEDYLWGNCSSDSSDDDDDDDDDDDWNGSTLKRHIYVYRQITKVLKTQIIKLKSAGLKVNNQNLKLISDVDDIENSNDENSDNYDFSCAESVYESNEKSNFSYLEVECSQEMEKMRMQKIGVYDLTFYDLLTRNIHFLCRYVRNKKIQEILEMKICNKKFPLYMDIIKCRFRDVKLRCRLLNSARKYFLLNITERLTDDCLNTVFSYLSLKELRMFIKAMKLLEE